MKNLILIIIIAFAPFAYVVQTGCATSNQVATYKTLAATQKAVASARVAFLDQYAKGTIKSEDAARALNASEQFNSAYNAAIVVAKTSNAPTPENVAQAASQFLVIVSTLIK